MTALSEQSQDSAQHSMQYHGAFHSPRSQADLRNSATGITRAAALPPAARRAPARRSPPPRQRLPSGSGLQDLAWPRLAGQVRPSHVRSGHGGSGQIGPSQDRSRHIMWIQCPGLHFAWCNIKRLKLSFTPRCGSAFVADCLTTSADGTAKHVVRRTSHEG